MFKKYREEQEEGERKKVREGSDTSKVQPTEATNATTADVNSNDDIDMGSDWFQEVPISDADKAEFENIIERCGYNALIQKLEAWNSDWKHPTINIAVAGAAGTGKSTLINSLRGLKDEDEGAAKTGSTETTTKVSCYPHPQNPNLKIWDLPGVGTPNFPRETYFKTVDFKNYDFLLLVSSARFTETDQWLAENIVDSIPNINLFFIRSHIDNDFENFKQGRRKGLTAEDRTDIAKDILKNCIESLINAKIRSAKVFLINSHRTDQFDFKQLQMSLVETVSDIKRDAMILSLTVHSVEILEKKVEVLRKQIPDAARHVTGETPSLRNLMEISCLYANQLGISTSSLKIIAKNFHRDVSELKRIVNMKIPAILASEKNFAKYCTIHGIGKIQCGSVLECMLQMCKDESKKLQTTIALWSHEDTK